MHNRVIDGRFELMERLGGGGMGLVWRAWDMALHREVALKEVRPPDPSMEEHDPTRARELRARVLREARALARLNHPHVATIHHIVDPGEQGYPWIVMELVTGGSLQDRLQRGPLTPAEAARLGREVLSALRAAHAVGIQHRDVKPANVLLREDGRSVLTDFGIAAVRESTSLTATGSFIGSPEYMAPERINGHEGDPASDLWSLGMLLYVAVEGRHPLRRSTTLATLAAVLNQDVPPPERAGALGPVLQALLRRDSAARPDAETLDRLLASATESGTFPPAPPGPAAHAGPQPPPWGPAPISQAKTVRSQRPSRVATHVGIAISVAALVVAGVLVWRFLPTTTTTVTGGDSTSLNVTPAASSDPESSAASSDPETSAETETESSEPENLLTPAGMKAMIAKVKKEIGGSKIVSMTVYPAYASISAPSKADKEVYDMYSYRDGAVAFTSKGGAVDGPLVDLDKYNWNTLPSLIKTANQDLGVPEPTTRYVIVDPDTTSGTPVLRVYVSDDYSRTGYLVANLQGKVVTTYRHE
ncbi:serine/threonine-protein kinase [Nonomuraea polychroma]|uniref:serine/threonine-protein kinase n=1 Tax=Nonomuraea polychroma TaxID=46176 RepID=UPI003D92F675